MTSMDKLQALKPRVLLYSHGGVGRDPQRLMAQVRENAQIYGDIVLQGLEAGEGKEGIARRLQEKFGLPVEGVESVMSLSGYILYHRKRGLPGA